MKQDQVDKDVLSALLSQMPFAVAMVDREMRYIAASDRWRFDYDLGSMPLVGRSHYEVFPEITEYWKALHRRCLAGETLRAEEDLFARANGQCTWLRWEIRPWGKRNGLPEGMLMYAEDITQRKEAEEALKRSEERFRDFARAGGDFLNETDSEGRYTWVWESGAANRGVPPNWYLGRRRIELAARGTDFEAEPWKSHLETLERREPFRDFRYLINDPAAPAILSVSGVPYTDAHGKFLGYRNVSHDVTMQVRTEQAARTANQRLRAAVENLNEFIVLTDSNDCLVAANRGFRELNAAAGRCLEPGTPYIELARAVLKAGQIQEAIGCEEAWLEKRIAARLDPQGAFEEQRQGGRWILVNDQRLPDGGTITYGLDITELKRGEERRMEAARSQRDALIREVHHRIKNNLQGVVGLLMQNVYDHPELTSLFQRAAAQVQLVAMVHGLQGQSTGGLQLSALVQAIAHNIASLTHANIAIEVTPAVAGVLLAERESVSVALIMNELMFNAVKHSTLEQNVRVHVDQLAGHVMVGVRNTGVLAATFDYDKAQGIGTGLELVRALTPANGIRLTFAQSGPAEILTTLELLQPVVEF